MIGHRTGSLRTAALAMLAGTLAACGAIGPPGSGSPPSPAASPAGAVSSVTAGSPGTAAGSPSACATPGSFRVSSASGLTAALASARPGQTIVLAPGVYQGDFVVTVSGTPAAPITLCGSHSAVLEGTSIQEGYTLYLNQASWWRLKGFTVEGGQKGVVADGVNHDLLYGLYVHSTGDEAIHLRSFSSHNVISHCVIRRTGLLVSFFGEGIYVGSAHSNWCRYTGCRPDASNDNVLVDNNIADTTAENIDIKEGTTGGTITGNHLDGVGMVAAAATAWVNVKGNGWTVENNFGMNSAGDGFQVHEVYPGWGIGNVFRGNRAHVNGPGYGIYVQSQSLHTTVACDNVVVAARQGLTSIPCSHS
jgi:Right handed beta helix region